MLCEIKSTLFKIGPKSFLNSTNMDSFFSSFLTKRDILTKEILLLFRFFYRKGIFFYQVGEKWYEGHWKNVLREGNGLFYFKYGKKCYEGVGPRQNRTYPNL